MTLVLAVALVLALLLALLAPALADPTWRAVWGELDAPSPRTAAPDGPVMVLGGSPARLPLALALPGVPGPSRPLIVSGSAVDDWRATGATCSAAHVVCVEPDPSSTYGEALTLAALAEERGWDAGPITVITSEFHVPRTRWQFAACTDLDVVVPSPGAGPAPEDQSWLEPIKLVNAGVRTACR